MSSSTEVENVNTKTSSNENNTQLTQAVVSESTTPDGSHSDGSTAQHGTAEHKFYVPPSALVFYGMAFFGLLCSFALRAGLSVAIVAMVNQTAVSDNIVMTNNSDNDQCPRDPVLQSRSGEFIWNRHEQGAVLAAYYYGQQVTMIPGGWLADRFGGKWLFGGSILLSSVISLLTPAAARLHLGFFLFLRILSGLGEGALLPALHALIARWSTPKYHSVVVSVIFTGTNVGIVLGMLVSGVLSDYGFASGWPSVFYVFGMVGCVWSAAWFFLCYDSPAVHPRISSTEREYWRLMLGTTNLVVRPPTPWRKIFSSIPVWALAVAFFAQNWGYYTLASCIPLFMYDVLGFDMTKNGVLSAVPFLAGLLLIPFGWLSDWLRSPGRLTNSIVRKSFCVIGFISSGCMLIWAGYTGCNRALPVVAMFLSISCSAVSFPVVAVNQLDLAPLHAGKIMGLTHFVGSLAAIVAPHAVGALTYEESSRSEWQNVFFLAAGILVVGAIIFSIVGSGKRQSWAKSSANRQDEPTSSQSGHTVILEQTVC